MLKPVTNDVWVDREGDGPAHEPIYKAPGHFNLSDLEGWSDGQPFGSPALPAAARG